MAIRYPVYENGKETGTRVEYAGCVLATRERNYYDDSDFYAVVWDEATQNIKEVEYDTTRCGGGGTADVDATPEVCAKVEAVLKADALKTLHSQNEWQAKHPTVGKRVRVTHKGGVMSGRIFWAGRVCPPWIRYHQERYATDRVGIEVDGNGKVFMDADDKAIEVENWEQYLVAEEELVKVAEARSKDYTRRSRMASAASGMLVANGPAILVYG